jgi:hypothetical protein
LIEYFQRYRAAAPLAVFRMALGTLLFAGIVRFWANGWIYDLYIAPKHFFSFYGFEFVQPLGAYTYLLFAICALSAILFALGLFYRIVSVMLFLSFSYIELIDKSTYLNHYYFISMICLLMIFLPAHVYFSLDALRNKKLAASSIPAWTIDSVKLLVVMLYFFAGIAKINTDWLLHAQPLRIWLPAKNDTPVIGFLFNYTWVAYAFSWIGCLYDLSIGFLLWKTSTRTLAYVAVVVFHALTAILFPIGMFPYIMIVTALIFFSDKFHLMIVNRMASRLRSNVHQPENQTKHVIAQPRFLISLLMVFFLFQAALPFRHVLYPDNLFWTEEGYRFSWRVMLMEKAGQANFIVRDRTGKQVVVENKDFLTALQEKQMSTQPDMLLQYAHILAKHYEGQGFLGPEVYVDSYVALNGRLGTPLVAASVNLASQRDSFAHKSWILPAPK